MDVRDAISTAKQGLIHLFSDEKIDHLGLEEVVPSGEGWNITLGFSRPWDMKNSLFVGVPTGASREYKVLEIDNSGKVVSIKNRD